MPRVFILLGGNLGDRFKTLSQAKKFVSVRAGIIQKESSVYESEPWGFEHENSFLNQVVVVKTEYPPEIVLQIAQDTEAELGRIRHNSGVYEGRIIDIDILFYDDKVMKQEDLKIPHPLIQERRFTLQPLAEIAPDMVHPVLQKTMKQLLDECADDQEAKRIW